MKQMSTQRTLTSSYSKIDLGLSEKDSVTKAEDLQALKIFEGNMSFASATGDSERFKIFLKI